MKWGLRENQLASCLFFSTFRNRCAHDERLYSFLSYANLCNNRYFCFFHINATNTNNYFAVMDAFKMLLTNKRYADYIDQLETLFKELSLQLSTISIRKTRGIMGIPNNWKRLKTLH